jgi:hypothetical protein
VVGRLGLDPWQGHGLFSSSHCPDQHWDPPDLLPNGCRCSFFSVKQPDRDANHSHSPSAEVMNVWSYTSSPHTSTCGAQLKHQRQLHRPTIFHFSFSYLPSLLPSFIPVIIHVIITGNLILPSECSENNPRYDNHMLHNYKTHLAQHYAIKTSYCAHNYPTTNDDTLKTLMKTVQSTY